jgi:hypothetical protein
VTAVGDKSTDNHEGHQGPPKENPLTLYL